MKLDNLLSYFNYDKTKETNNTYIKKSLNEKESLFTSIPLIEKEVKNSNNTYYYQHFIIDEEKITIKDNENEATISFYDDVNISFNFDGLLINANQSSIKGEIILNKHYEILSNDNYLIFNKNEYDPFFIIAPFYGEKNNDLTPLNITYSIRNDKVEFEIISNNATSLNVEINYYLKKLILDNVLSFNEKDKNNAYAIIAFLKENQDEYLLRLNYTMFNDITCKNVDKALLYIKILNKSDNLSIKCYKNKYSWCSHTTSFNNKPEIEDEYECFILNDYLVIDISECVNDFITMTNLSNGGFTLKVTNGFLTLATADCYTYPLVLKVIEKELN